MKTLILFVFLIYLSSCSNCSLFLQFESPPFRCIYSVRYASQSCSNPIFQACTVTINTTSNVYNNRQLCSKYCCIQQNIVCPPSVSQQTANISLTMIAAILCALIIAGCIIIFCYNFHEGITFCLSRYCCCMRGNAVDNAPTLGINETHVDLEPSLQREWSQDTRNIKQEDCPVCLCRQVNLMLDCGHFYHRECIIECFRRKFECVLCRTNQLKCYRLFCEGCFQSYMEIYAVQLSRFKGVKNIHCPTCSFKNLIV